MRSLDMVCNVCSTFPGHQLWCHKSGSEDKQNEPLLGLATTRELLTELRSRGEVEHIAYGSMFGELMAQAANALLEDLPEPLLNYSTVEGR